MTHVAVITDTNSGFTQPQADLAGVFLLPMPFMIDGKSFHEGVDIDFETFYQRLQQGADVSTSQPAPNDVTTLWDRLLEEGFDQIVYLPMSSGLSNSCQTALLLAQDYGGKVQVIDNHRISVTLKQSVFDALALARTGKSALEIKEILEHEALDASIYISVDTLEYLKKGGRVTAAGAAIGTVLNIKPVLTIQGDKLDAFAKVRGMKAAKKTMLEAVKKDIQNRFSALYEAGELGIYFAHTDIDDSAKNEWKQQLEQAFPQSKISGDPLAMSIGCHIGPGALAVGVCKTRHPL